MIKYTEQWGDSWSKWGHVVVGPAVLGEQLAGPRNVCQGVQLVLGPHIQGDNLKGGGARMILQQHHYNNYSGKSITRSKINHCSQRN